MDDRLLLHQGAEGGWPIRERGRAGSGCGCRGCGASGGIDVVRGEGEAPHVLDKLAAVARPHPHLVRVRLRGGVGVGFGIGVGVRAKARLSLRVEG